MRAPERLGSVDAPASSHHRHKQGLALQALALERKYVPGHAVVVVVAAKHLLPAGQSTFPSERLRRALAAYSTSL